MVRHKVADKEVKDLLPGMWADYVNGQWNTTEYDSIEFIDTENVQV